MKDFVKIGDSWFNPASIHMIKLQAEVEGSDAHPAVHVFVTGSESQGPVVLEGEDAEEVLKQLGHKHEKKARKPKKEAAE